jgi:hypothetical protein
MPERYTYLRDIRDRFTPESIEVATQEFLDSASEIAPRNELLKRIHEVRDANHHPIHLEMLFAALEITVEKLRAHASELEQAVQKPEIIGKVLEAWQVKSLVEARIDKSVIQKRKKQAKHAAETRHNKPGGSRDKTAQIQAIWASGKYDSRDRCAEEEARALGMSISTARRKLQNTPEPPSRS